MGKRGIIRLLPLCILLLFFVVGCAGLTKSLQKKDTKDEGKKTAALSPTVSEFEDVKIPPEMELDRGESMVYESYNLRMGVLYYSGKMELPETVDFFKVNMPKQGWELLNSFQHKTHILNFAKGDRSCIIIVAKPKMGKTEVQVWMGPLQRRK